MSQRVMEEKRGTSTMIRTENLRKYFTADSDFLTRIFGWGDQTQIKAVDGVSFEIKKGEAYGLAGESGCGKTTLGKTLLRLHEPTAGKIYFDNTDISENATFDESTFRTQAQAIQQNPYESLNPRFKVSRLVKEPLDIHNLYSRQDREEKVHETLEEVGLKPADDYWGQYPTELSGGEKQRVAIARAIIMDPDFIVADEPVSMLDVSIRAEILKLLQRLQEENDLSVLYISHDLALLNYMCDRVGIMYLGKLVEEGPTGEVIGDPKHPYTQALLAATPTVELDRKKTTPDLKGDVPDPIDLPPGCRFAPRCPEYMEKCSEAEPPMYDISEGHCARCVLYEDGPQ